MYKHKLLSNLPCSSLDIAGACTLKSSRFRHLPSIAVIKIPENHYTPSELLPQVKSKK
jgi:hypothetical protein